MKHIFTILDGFTWYLTAIPIPDLESTTLLNTFMEGFVLKFGLPEVVHSDNRSSLLNKQFQDSLHQLGIKNTQTPVYSPEGNRVERSHLTMGTSLRSDDSTCPGSLPIKLNTILFELNNAKNRVTGVSPYFGMFGRNPRLLLDLCFPSQNFQKSHSWTKYLENLSSRFKEFQENMIKNELNLIPTDQGIKSPRGMDSVKVGDLVTNSHHVKL